MGFGPSRLRKLAGGDSVSLWPDEQNGIGCPCSVSYRSSSSGDPSLVQIAITLDYECLRGSIAAVHSVLTHITCLQNVFFDLITAQTRDSMALGESIADTPSLEN